MRLSLLPAAAEELHEAAVFYARQANRELGLALLAEFERAAHLIQSNPTIGSVYQSGCRRYLLRRFPYSVIYQVVADELRVIAVAHQRRRPGYWSARTPTSSRSDPDTPR